MTLPRRESAPSRHDHTNQPSIPTELPATIRGYLAAHAARDTDAALRAFSPDRRGRRRGTRPSAGPRSPRLPARTPEPSSATRPTLVGAQRIDDAHWVAANRLEGDFPGGVADLDYRFTMDGDRIAELVIAV